MVQLDVLRGVAILLVVFTHNIVGAGDAGSWAAGVRYMDYLSPTGVDLFFVLSGFLIGGLLFKEIHASGRLDVRRFLVRRAFRIWPPYFVFIAFLFVWLPLYEGRAFGDTFQALLPNLLHVQNYLDSPRRFTWSLAVEEHFYLALPFLLVLLARPGTTKIPAIAKIALGLFVACAFLRLLAFSSPQPYTPTYATHLRIDSLFFGVLLAYLHRFEPAKLAFAERHRGKLLLAGAVILLLYPTFVRALRDTLLVETLGFTLVFVAYGCFLLALVHTPVGAGRLGAWLQRPTARALAFIGYFSYPMYLWHVEAAKVARRLVPSESMPGLLPELRWLLALVAYVLVSLAVAVAVAIILDKPMLALRDRLFPARGSAAPQPSPLAVPAANP